MQLSSLKQSYKTKISKTGDFAFFLETLTQREKALDAVRELPKPVIHPSDLRRTK